MGRPSAIKGCDRWQYCGVSMAWDFCLWSTWVNGAALGQDCQTRPSLGLSGLALILAAGRKDGLPREIKSSAIMVG